MNTDSIIHALQREFEKVDLEHKRMMERFQQVNHQHTDMMASFTHVEKDHQTMSRELAEIKTLLASILEKLDSK